MNNIQYHRGPDDNGIWISENNNVGLAHTRLSIIDLDKRSKQPMKKKKYIITFNGEIYNYIEIKKKSKNFISYTSQDKKDNK